LHAGGEIIPASKVVLAVGHSSRAMYETLAARGIALSPKPFALGLRVEHPQALIDNIQYGQEYAAGALSWHVHELSNSINVMLLPLSFSGVIKASCCYPSASAGSSKRHAATHSASADPSMCHAGS